MKTEILTWGDILCLDTSIHEALHCWSFKLRVSQTSISGRFTVHNIYFCPDMNIFELFNCRRLDLMSMT